MFHGLPPLQLTPVQVNSIVDLMHERVVDAGGVNPGGGWQPPPPAPDLDNEELPSGYTYLGQFIDHDVTFDPASQLDRKSDPNALHNFRTPRLDLDSVYGAGPQDQPYLYDTQDDDKFLVVPNQLGEVDLPRNVQGRALIGDPRNDENMIVSQLHLVFMKAHNRLVDELRAGAYPDARRSHVPVEVFDEANRLLRWHYQYIVATDFLWRICGPITQQLLHNTSTGGDGKPTWVGRLRHGPPNDRPLRYKPYNNAYMPVEFAVGAYRYGHSQPRPGYELNGTVSAALFVDDPQGPQDIRHLGGFRPLINGWSIEWGRFFQIANSTPQHSRLIDTQITEPLFFLGPPPAEDALGDRRRQLPWRNIMRSLALELPSGEAIALDLGVDRMPIPELKAVGIAQTPLWYYVLAEAGEQQHGVRLGDVGGRIVAEVLLGLLQRDVKSFLREEPGWKPFLGVGESAAQYEIATLISYATEPA